MTYERRRAPRYWLDTEILVNSAHERTLDISSTSVRFETVHRYGPGDEVALVFPLHQLSAGARVQCSGRVLRVDRRGATFSVVATYEPVAFNVAT